MSQHHFEGTQDGKPVTVTMGYDRPLDYVFCTVVDAAGETIYCNLEDAKAGVTQQDVGHYRGVLAESRIAVPESMFVETAKDQAGRVGNKNVIHKAVQRSALVYSDLSDGRSECKPRAIVEPDATLAKALGAGRRPRHSGNVLRSPSNGE